MELPIFAVFLASFILSVGSHPKHSDVIPKEYYKRQILQPIPGYIPVYIKADGVPIVRSETRKPAPEVNSQKVSEPKEKQLFKETEEKASSEAQEKKSEVKNETKVLESQTPLPKLQEKLEPTVDHTKTEKQVGDSQGKPDNLKSLI